MAINNVTDLLVATMKQAGIKRIFGIELISDASQLPYVLENAIRAAVWGFRRPHSW
jgi:hypothetical protein